MDVVDTPEEDPSIASHQQQPVMQKLKTPPVQRSVRAGLVFPVGRIHRLLKKQFNGPVGETSAVYLAAVLQYLSTEVLDQAALEAQSKKRKRITPRHVYLGIENDEDLKSLCDNTGVIIPESGVKPNPALWAKRRRKEPAHAPLQHEQDLIC